MVFVIHQAHFQRGGTPQDILGARGVLHPRQLHHDAVGTLLLDHRLGHTQFIHAVAQRDQVLLYGRLLYAYLLLLPESGEQQEFPAFLACTEFQSAETLLELRLAFVARVRIAKPGGDHAVVATHAGIGNIRLTQGTAYIAGIRLQGFIQRAFHIDLQQKMHTAAEI